MSNNSQMPVKVCPVTRLTASGRLHMSVSGREIVVFHHNGKYYALDSKCYHMGGPLEQGQIEELPHVGHTCIVCPWHKYKISLSTGEGFYQAFDIKTPKTPPCWKSKGIKQRTHKVFEENGDLYVQLSDITDKTESDYYYTEEYKNKMAKSKR